MTKSLKKCYRFLSLRFDATEKEVKVRQQIMVNNLQAKTKHKKQILKIEKINNCANAILQNIKQNGVPKFSIVFNTSLESLGTMFLWVIILFVFAALAFKLML